MALIEIDVVPAANGEPASWSVKINSKERSGIDDEYHDELPSWKAALDIVHTWMTKEVLF